MGVHKDYPAGTEPTAGPFKIVASYHNEGDPENDLAHVFVERDNTCDPVLVYVRTTQSDFAFSATAFLTPAEARELAAALIECADHIDRASMTTEDIARETRNRC